MLQRDGSRDRPASRRFRRRPGVPYGSRYLHRTLCRECGDLCEDPQGARLDPSGGAAAGDDARQSAFSYGNQSDVRLKRAAGPQVAGEAEARRTLYQTTTDNVAHHAEPCSRVLGAELASLTRRRLTRTDVQESQLRGAFSEWPTIHLRIPRRIRTATGRYLASACHRKTLSNEMRRRTAAMPG
jgi:hypothetical protein